MAMFRNYLPDVRSGFNHIAKKNKRLPFRVVPVPNADGALAEFSRQAGSNQGRQNAIAVSSPNAIQTPQIETSVGKLNVNPAQGNAQNPQLQAPTDPALILPSTQPASPAPAINRTPSPSPLPAPAVNTNANFLPQVPATSAPPITSPVRPYNPLTPDAQGMAPPSLQLDPQVMAANSLRRLHDEQFLRSQNPQTPGNQNGTIQTPDALPSGIPPQLPGDTRTAQQRLDQIAQGRAESASSPGMRSYFVNGQWQTLAPNDPQVLALKAAIAPAPPPPPAPITDVEDPNYFGQFPPSPNIQELQAAKATVDSADIPALAVFAQNLTPAQFLKELHRSQEAKAAQQTQTEQQAQAQKQKAQATQAERDRTDKYVQGLGSTKLTAQGNAAIQWMNATGKTLPPSPAWFVTPNDALPAQQEWAKDPAHLAQLKTESRDALLAANEQGRVYSLRSSDFIDTGAAAALQQSVQNAQNADNAKRSRQIANNLNRIQLTDSVGLRTKLVMSLDNLLGMGGMDPALRNDIQTLRDKINAQAILDSEAKASGKDSTSAPVDKQNIILFNQLAQRAANGVDEKAQAGNTLPGEANTASPVPDGRIRVTDGVETYDILPSDLQSAQADGFTVIK